MKTIIVSEEKERVLIEAMLNEKFGGLGDAVKTVAEYLDKHFSRATSTIIGADGKPEVQQVVAWLDDYKQVIKTLTDVQLFYILQEEFKSIIADKDERDKFLKQVIKDWYNKKITANNSLTAY